MGWIISQILELAWDSVGQVAYRKSGWGCWAVVTFGPIFLFIAIVGLFYFLA